MELAPSTRLHGFTVLDVQTLPEIDGRAHVLVHDKSKARLLYLENDDNNKAFAIGFRTPPQDDTGVFHILEHSVLCGSERFPVKEPFVDLLKTSMQTFLNAMTFPDKTLYPVASTNERDLFNLMDVYLDAVFHPLIYRKRAVFEQEGWHFELASDAESDATASGADASAENAESEQVSPRANANTEDGRTGSLSYNGVVYNEMKGALSDSSSVLFDELQKALFPDNAYAFESGGIPRAITELTYEGYLDEHRRHYRLDNSYTLLYGNLDIERALSFLDTRCFSPVADEQAASDAERAQAGLDPLVPRALALQTPVENLAIVRTMDTAPENACSGVAYVIGSFEDRTRVVATDILLDALLGSNEAPLKRALLDADVADDVTAYVADSMLQPFAVVQMRLPREGARDRLVDLVAENLEALLAEGLDPQVIEASLSRAEFVMREHDFGTADGVILAMSSLAGWLYGDGHATTYLRYEESFAELRAGLKTRYFDRLARELFLENAHRAKVDVVPDPGMPDDETARLAAIESQLTSADRARIIEEEAVLRDLQTRSDTPEAVATLPRLGISDIDDAPQEPRIDLDWRTPLACLRHDIPTRGIAYAYRYFDADALTFEDLPYLGILALVLGKLGTAHHSAAELDTLIQGRLGDLSFYTDLYEDRESPLDPSLKLIISASALSENATWLATLPREIALESDFSDTAKIKDVLLQRKIALEQGFANAGHSCASARARSYYTPGGIVQEHIGNVDFYLFLKDLLANFEERAASLPARLAHVAATVFVDNACTVSFTGSDADYDAFWLAGPGIGRAGETARGLVIPEPRILNEAFVVPTDVSYTAQGFDLRLLGRAYSGTWPVAARTLTYDFLWNEVRVKGGAYGVGFQATRAGNLRFYSYRDPHLDDTLARFAQASVWLDSFDPSRADLEGFVVSTVAGFDTPMKARQLIRRQDTEFFAHRTPEERAVIRSEIIEVSVEAVRSLAEPLAQAVERRAFCTFGNKDIVAESKSGLKVIDLLGA